MPQNIAPHGAVQIPVPKTFENKPMEMVRAVRDTLLNYVNAVELQLASSPAASPAGRPRRNAPEDVEQFPVRPTIPDLPVAPGPVKTWYDGAGGTALTRVSRTPSCKGLMTKD